MTWRKAYIYWSEVDLEAFPSIPHENTIPMGMELQSWSCLLQGHSQLAVQYWCWNFTSAESILCNQVMIQHSTCGLTETRARLVVFPPCVSGIFCQHSPLRCPEKKKAWLQVSNSVPFYHGVFSSIDMSNQLSLGVSFFQGLHYSFYLSLLSLYLSVLLFYHS